MLRVNLGDVLTLIGDLAALAAAVFAFLALGKANETITEAKAQRLLTEAATAEATEADRQASAERQAATEAAKTERLEAEQQRLIRRVERVGQLVEDLFWKAAYSDAGAKAQAQAQARPSNRLIKVDLMSLTELPPVGDLITPQLDAWAWMADRNRLGQALVGLRNRLPQCVALVAQAKMAEQAFELASQARNEVDLELRYLHGELTRPTAD